MRRQEGFTLIEVLLVSVVFLIVLTGTVTAMTGFERLNRDNQRVNDQTERVRRSVERGMRQLRNLATRPDTGQPTIARADGNDFIFQTSDPTRTWVRYCTQATADGSAAIWSMSNATSTLAPTEAACPGSQSPSTGWPTRNQVATNVTNYAISGRNQPLLTYGRDCSGTASATCTTDLGSITSVSMDVLLDDSLTKNPPEVRVSSGVFLRNQNEKPSASYTWRALNTQGIRQVLLNASASSDPEGRTLRYFWYRTAAPSTFTCSDPDGPANDITYYQGLTLTYTFPDGDASGTYAPFELVVCDPGDLTAKHLPPTDKQVVIP